MSSISVETVITYFREELRDLYDAEEVENFIWYTFESFLHFSKMDLRRRSSEAISGEQLLKFKDVVARLKQYEPIQYILGTTEFYGLKFQVNPAVLIPRPETEELVHLMLKDIKNENRQDPVILDIGTGSGCISISLKKNIPAASIYAIDISENALRLAEKNAEQHQTDIHFIKMNILDEADTKKLNKFDVIVSNPPYVGPDEKQQMKANVLNYEPHQALFTPVNDPLIFYRVIAGFAVMHLNQKGKLYFEINELFGNEVKQLLENKGFRNVNLWKDLSNKHRMIGATI